MKRPLIYVSVFLAAGIFFGKYGNYFGFAAALAIVSFASVILYKMNNDKLTLIMPVIYMTGIIVTTFLGEKRYDIDIAVLKELRENITRLYFDNLPKREAEIITAMITGDKSGLEKDVIKLYKGAGIYHILAISGLHVGIIAAFLKSITDRINKRYGRIFICIILVIYAVFTGGSASVVRAVIMSCALLMRNIFRRDGDFLSAIAFAATVILLFKPSELFDIGFQYSFAAVTTIGIFAKKVEYICDKRKPLAYIINTITVYISMKAISVYYFGYITFVDIISSIIFIPMTSVLVGFGAATAVIGLFWESIGGFLLSPVYYILKFYEFVCTIICEADILNTKINGQGIVEIGLFFACVLSIGYMINGHYGFEKERIKYFAVCTALFLGDIIIKGLIFV